MVLERIKTGLGRQGRNAVPQRRTAYGSRRDPQFVSSPLFIAARAVVNAEDPIGPLAIDAPVDEYDSEVMDLVKWRTALTAEDVVAVFVRWFGADYRLPEDMARRIAEGINEARTRLHPYIGEGMPFSAAASGQKRPFCPPI